MQFLHESDVGSGNSISGSWHRLHKPFISFRPAHYSRMFILRHLPCKDAMADISVGHDDEQEHRLRPDPASRSTTM